VLPLGSLAGALLLSLVLGISRPWWAGHELGHPSISWLEAPAVRLPFRQTDDIGDDRVPFHATPPLQASFAGLGVGWWSWGAAREAGGFQQLGTLPPPLWSA